MPFKTYGTRGANRGVKRSPLKSYEKSPKRRRTSITTRIKYKRPTANNQKKQLLTLAKRVTRNTQILDTQKVFTDYQWGQTDSRGMFASLNTSQWYGWRLTTFNQWQAVLRQDANVADSARTYAIRAQLNCRVNIGDVTQLSYINVFLVTPRKDAVDTLTIQNDVGGMVQLSPNVDFIQHTSNEAANLRLNSAKFKVLACKYVTLTPNSATQPLPAGFGVGNPYSTWRKWQWNVPLKFTIRQPSGDRPWTNLQFGDLPYHQKLYVLVYSGSAPINTRPDFICDAMFTCVNFA